jgi:hypothetical protein
MQRRGTLARPNPQGLFGVHSPSGAASTPCLVGGGPFELLRQFQVFLGDFAHPLLGLRVPEGLGFDQDFLGVISRIPRERQKPLVRHWRPPQSHRGISWSRRTNGKVAYHRAGRLHPGRAEISAWSAPWGQRDDCRAEGAWAGARATGRPQKGKGLVTVRWYARRNAAAAAGVGLGA